MWTAYTRLGVERVFNVLMSPENFEKFKLYHAIYGLCHSLHQELDDVARECRERDLSGSPNDFLRAAILIGIEPEKALMAWYRGDQNPRVGNLREFEQELRSILEEVSKRDNNQSRIMSALVGWVGVKQAVEFLDLTYSEADMLEQAQGAGLATVTHYLLTNTTTEMMDLANVDHLFFMNGRSAREVEAQSVAVV